ncbi:15593_t:CDS:2 [Rhizophagus irregularis]|nr:15593_t:CDS:2 [Rhizophagus irregularis]
MRLNPPIDINTRPMGIPRSRLTIKSLFNIRLSLLSAVATTPQDIDIPDDLKPFNQAAKNDSMN